MRIAVFHELPQGGARKATNYLAKYLKNNHIVDLYYSDTKKDNSEKENYSHIYFFHFKEKKWKGNNWKTRLYKDTLELFKNYYLHQKIAQQIRKKNYDLIFVNASKFIESPFLLKFEIPQKFFYLHDPHYRMIYENIDTLKVNKLKQIYENANRKVRKYLDKKNLQGATYYIANSNYTKNKFANSYKKQSQVIYLGVNTNIFKPTKIKKDIDVLYIGSYQPVDGFYLLEEALQFFIKKPVIKTIMWENEWIKSEENMSKLFNRSKIVVCLARNEPFGLTAIEAMGCGVPVVAINEGGYKETVVDGKTGYLIKQDAKLLATKIKYLLSHPKIRQKMGKNARNEVLQKWTWEKSGEKLEKLLLSVI